MLALLVAGTFAWRKPLDALEHYWLAAKALRGTRSNAPLKLQRKRWKTCLNCPIFYPPLRTCGTPLRKDLYDFGCWCNMEAKIKRLESRCWLNDNANTKYGWNERKRTRSPGR